MTVQVAAWATMQQRREAARVDAGARIHANWQALATFPVAPVARLLHVCTARGAVVDDWWPRVLAAPVRHPPGQRPVAEVLRGTTRWERQV